MFGSELSILALYGLVVAIVLVIQVLIAAGQVGLPRLASPRDDMPPPAVVPGRAERALRNCFMALALFAPAVLILSERDAFTGSTLLACQIFLIARILYVPVYLAGIPWLRTGIWAVGFLATVWLYVVALGAGDAPLPA